MSNSDINLIQAINSTLIFPSNNPFETIENDQSEDS